MISFTLNNGVKVVPTSFHGSRFNDGTVFSPTEEQISQIKSDWSVLTVKREFTKVDCPVDGIGASSSRQTMTDEGLKALKDVCASDKNLIVLVSFMVVSALREMGVRDEYPQVLCANATRETSRCRPDEKVWDVNNFAY